MTREDELFIINLLRQGKVFVRVGQKGQRIYKYYWQCAKCKEWFRDEKSMEVDHIEEVGPFKGCFDEYVRRVYCRQSNLQLLCVAHHLAKTLQYSSAREKWKRKRKR